MPRQPKFNIDSLLSILISNKSKIINPENGNINPPTSDCWNEISKELSYTISSKYIYTIVKLNRYGINDKLVDNFDSATTTIEKKVIDDEESDIFSDDYKSDEETILNFNMTLSKEEWNSIHEPTETLYKRSDKKYPVRSYQTLKCNVWAPLIHEHFFEQTRLPCTIVYKKAKIYNNGNVYLDILGYCSTCLSNFKGVVDKQPEPNSRVVIKCSLIGNFKTCKPSSKRRINGEQKINAISKMVTGCKSASYVRREMAKNLMNFGDQEPSHLPSSNALRVIKCKAIKQGLHNDDPIISLFIMKGLSPYDEIIHDIGYDRFFMHYWSTTEINLYRTYSKTTKTPTISIDATGGIVRKPSLISGRITSNIFLYEISVMDRINCCQFSVAHMLSERHDNNSIGNWLSEWLRTGVPQPKVIVTDQSLALMMAAVRSFTQYSSLAKYLYICSLLINNKTTELPKCMIRNDFNHVMHILST